MYHSTCTALQDRIFKLTATDVATYLAIIVPVMGFTGWVIRHYLEELKPNGGGSLNDTIKLEILPLIKELRADQIDIKEKVAKLEGRFEQHVEEGE